MKQFTLDDDLFLRAYGGACGNTEKECRKWFDFLGTHDLGFPDGYGSQRAAFLVKLGLWGLLHEMENTRITDAEFKACKEEYDNKKKGKNYLEKSNQASYILKTTSAPDSEYSAPKVVLKKIRLTPSPPVAVR